MQFGIRSISIDDICNDLRISKKTFYQIFPKKEDLVEAVLQYQTSTTGEKFQKLTKNKNAIDVVVLIIREVRSNSHEDLSVFHYDLAKYYPSISNKYQEIKTEAIRASFEENLRQGIAEGYYREDLDIELGAMFHAVLLRNFQNTMELYPKVGHKRILNFYIDVIVRLITNEKGLKYIESIS